MPKDFLKNLPASAATPSSFAVKASTSTVARALATRVGTPVASPTTTKVAVPVKTPRPALGASSLPAAGRATRAVQSTSSASATRRLLTPSSPLRNVVRATPPRAEGLAPNSTLASALATRFSTPPSSAPVRVKNLPQRPRGTQWTAPSGALHNAVAAAVPQSSIVGSSPGVRTFFSRSHPPQVVQPGRVGGESLTAVSPGDLRGSRARPTSIPFARRPQFIELTPQVISAIGKPQTGPVSAYTGKDLWAPKPFGMPEERPTLRELTESGALANLDRKIDSALLDLMVQKARTPDVILDRGFAASGSDANVWQSVWEARKALGPIDGVSPPWPNLAKAILDSARAEPTTQTSNQVLARALNVVEFQKKLRGTTRSILDAVDFGGSPASSETKLDPYAIDVGLLVRLVNIAADTTLSVRQVFDRAWAALAAIAATPSAVPARDYVAAIVEASRAIGDTGGAVSPTLVNEAKARLLFRRLGGDENAARVANSKPVRIIERLLLTWIVEWALRNRPPNWGTIVWDMNVDLRYQGSREQPTPVEVSKRRAARAEFGRLLSFGVDMAWSEAISRRADRWELPWPPPLLPDRALVRSLITAAWTYPTMSERDLFLIALAQLDRYQPPVATPGSDDGPLGKIQQAVLEEVVIGIVVYLGFWGTVAAAVGIVGLAICLAGGCVELYQVIKDALKDPPDEDEDDDLNVSDQEQRPNPTPGPQQPKPGSPDSKPQPDSPSPQPTRPKPDTWYDGRPWDDFMRGPLPFPNVPPTLPGPFPSDPSPSPIPRDGPVNWFDPKHLPELQPWKDGPPSRHDRPEWDPYPDGGGPLPDEPLPDPPKPWNDIPFLESLCNDIFPLVSRYGFGLREILSVWAAESGMNPRATNLYTDPPLRKATVAGLNQMQVANVMRFCPKGYSIESEAYWAYVNFSRAEQLECIMNFLRANLAGLDPVGMRKYTPTQRATVLYYQNAGCSLHNVDEWNQVARGGIFPLDWDVYSLKSCNDKNIGLTEWRQAPYTDEWWKQHAVVMVQDLYFAVEQKIQAGGGAVDKIMESLAGRPCNPRH